MHAGRHLKLLLAMLLLCRVVAHQLFLKQTRGLLGHSWLGSVWLGGNLRPLLTVQPVMHLIKAAMHGQRLL